MTLRRETSRPRPPRARGKPDSVDDTGPPVAASDAGQNGERLLTLSEAAFQLGRVHRTTIMRWVKEGKLRCVRLSRKAILFEPREIERFITEHRSST